jgi:toxin ParE1/3/4
MPMGRVALTSPARADLDAIWSYIAKDNLSAADRLVDEIFERCRVFADQPMAATPADQFKPGLRDFSASETMWFFTSPKTMAFL